MMAVPTASLKNTVKAARIRAVITIVGKIQKGSSQSIEGFGGS